MGHTSRSGTAHYLGTVEVHRRPVNRAALDQGTALYIEVFESPHEFRLSSKVGARRPLHVTALGKALLAFLPDERREKTLNAINFEPVTPNGIINSDEFRRELDRVRQKGYALDNEEVVLGARCFGAPILGAYRAPIAAISVSGPVTRLSLEAVPVLAGTLLNAARAISVGMGFSPGDSEPTDAPLIAKKRSVVQIRISWECG